MGTANSSVMRLATVMATRGDSSVSYLEALVEALTHVSPGLCPDFAAAVIELEGCTNWSSLNQPFHPSLPKAKLCRGF